MKNIIYDCEIIKCIPQGEILSNYEYCGGWDDFEGMGISVICAIDLESDRTYIFSKDFQDFQELVDSTDKIFGFNSKNFDDNLCNAHGITVTTDFDLLEQVRLSAYGSSEWFHCPKGYTYKLDALAKSNGLGGKTGSGEQAPKLWQQGKRQEVIDYCINDVILTKQLIIKFLDGHLKDPNTNKILLP